MFCIPGAASLAYFHVIGILGYEKYSFSDAAPDSNPDFQKIKLSYRMQAVFEIKQYRLVRKARLRERYLCRCFETKAGIPTLVPYSVHSNLCSMFISAKFVATFILGTAAGVALQRYMRTEEGEKLMEDLKATANDLRSEAEEAVDRAPQYIEEIKAKGAEVLNKALPEAEKFMRDLAGTFSSKKPGGSAA